MKKAHASATSSLPTIHRQRGFSRRTFLRGAGIVLSLPLLDAMRPAMGAATDAAGGVFTPTKPRRMLAICNNLGLLPDQFFPKTAGRDYEASPYLDVLS